MDDRRGGAGAAAGDLGTLSGPATQMNQARAIREQKVARAEFIAGASGGAVVEIVEDEPSHDIVVATDSGPVERGPRPPPTEAGDLRQVPRRCGSCTASPCERADRPPGARGPRRHPQGGVLRRRRSAVRVVERHRASASATSW
jgi:hypothetical protein